VNRTLRIRRNKRLNRSGRSDAKSSARLALLSSLGSALIGALSGLLVACLATLTTFTALQEEVEAATAAATTSYAREVGTQTLVDYVNILIEAESVHLRAIDALRNGSTPEQREQLSDDLNNASAAIKARKGPVDLIAVDDVDSLAALSIDLYGQNGGDLAAALEEHPEGSESAAADYQARYECEVDAGRTIFTRVAHDFLFETQSHPSLTMKQNG
jgi:hypothetical protein